MITERKILDAEDIIAYQNDVKEKAKPILKMLEGNSFSKIKDILKTLQSEVDYLQNIQKLNQVQL